MYNISTKLNGIFPLKRNSLFGTIQIFEGYSEIHNLLPSCLDINDSNYGPSHRHRQ